MQQFQERQKKLKEKGKEKASFSFTVYKETE